MKKIEFFKLEGDKINRVRKHCPKCGPGVFLAEHKNRFSCGKCGYTEYKGGGIKPQPPKAEEKLNEQIIQEPVEVKPVSSVEKPKEEVPIPETAQHIGESSEEKPIEEQPKKEAFEPKPAPETPSSRPLKEDERNAEPIEQKDTESETPEKESEEVPEQKKEEKPDKQSGTHKEENKSSE